MGDSQRPAGHQPAPAPGPGTGGVRHRADERGAITNRNGSANLLRCKFYVCPVCGNIIHCTGDTVVSCCGITLPALEPEPAEESHSITIEPVEDEYFLTVPHEMTKQHFISFLAHVTTDRLQLVKLYPEGNAQTRLQLRGRGYLYFYCNRHGLFRQKL